MALSPILEIAQEILQSAGRKGMHVSEIAQAAVAQNKNMGLPVEDFQKKVAAALAGNLKLKATKPSFAQVNHDKGPRKGKPRQGWYRCREVRNPQPEPPKPKEAPTTSFTGKGGEYAVMSELLFWGYNASIMTVDDGVDIVAGKDGNFFFVQVKTAMPQDNGKFLFTIRKTSFQKYNGANSFYVFVMRNNEKNDFIVLPAQQIKHFIGTGCIKENTSLSITITSNNKKTAFFINGNGDVTQYFGAFDRIA